MRSEDDKQVSAEENNSNPAFNVAHNDAKHMAHNDVKHMAHNDAKHMAHNDVKHMAHNDVKHMAHNDAKHMTHNDVKHMAHNDVKHMTHNDVKHMAHDDVKHMAHNDVKHMAHNNVRHIAMGIMALLRNDKKKALQQVKQLIKMKKEMACAVLTSNVDGWTPVHACVLRGHKKLLKTMLQAGISINCTMGQPEGLPGRCTLLHVAANRTDKKMLDYLLHHGADVNARDSDGNTALFYARQSNKDSARLLINCGATLDDSNSYQHPHHHQTQHHNPCESKPTRHRHGSSSSLRNENTHQSPVADSCHQLQTQTPQQNQRQPNGSGNSLTTPSSTVEATTATTKSQFLTVPPTKFFSSSPCLHNQGPSVSNSATSFTNSSSSANNIRTPDKKSPRKAKNTLSITNNNNNNTTVADLNTKRGLKHCSRGEYASSESLMVKPGLQRSQNHSD